MCGYYFGDGQQWEAKRLRAVERYADPATRAVLQGLGVGPGWVCWEIGAGFGSVAYWLSERVAPEGAVLATDIDTSHLEDRPNLDISHHDVLQDALPDIRFDLVHTRFLLEHLPEPAAVACRMAAALRPGGWLVVEDAGGLDMLIEPARPELQRLWPAWEEAAVAVGWDPAFGEQLTSVLTGCGLEEVEALTYRRHGSGGPIWEAARLGLASLEDRIVERGGTSRGVAQALEVLVDPSSMIIGAPVVVAWGRSS